MIANSRFRTSRPDIKSSHIVPTLFEYRFWIILIYPVKFLIPGVLVEVVVNGQSVNISSSDTWQTSPHKPFTPELAVCSHLYLCKTLPVNATVRF